jgi:hypothetical protein
VTTPRIGIAAKTTAKTRIGIGTRELDAIRRVVVAETLHQIVEATQGTPKSGDITNIVWNVVDNTTFPYRQCVIVLVKSLCKNCANVVLNFAMKVLIAQ